MVQRFVGSIEAPGGKVAAIGGDVHGDVVLASGAAPLYAGCPPALPYRLVGRDAALAELRDKLCGGGSAALTALNGLPGVGKTALATALVYDPAIRDHFKGGIFWAGLGPQGDVESAFNRWAAAMGSDVESAFSRWAAAIGGELHPARQPREKAKELAARIQHRAQGEPVLLVADDVWNEEHARLVRAVAFPGCAYLCTTRDARVARRFAGEPTWVRELSDEEAEALLAARCHEAKKADPEGLRALAKAAAGLPLGLSLIAVALADRAGHAQWVRKEIERLSAAEARLELAEEDPRPGLEGVPATLRAIVEMSVTALEPDVQSAFAMLGAFAPKPADFVREAAFAVWEVEESMGDAWLQPLVERGLLEAQENGRFTLHQVLGAVAEARLDGETGARARHARFYRELAGGAPEDWRCIEGELAQIQKGWEWVSAEGGREAEVVAHAHALDIFFQRRGMWQERIRWLQRSLLAARSLKQRGDEGEVLNSIGGVYSHLGDKKRALETFEQALSIRREIGGRRGEAVTLVNIGTVCSDLGDKKRALETYEQALPILREVGDRGGEAVTLNNLGKVYSDLGDKKRALENLEQALSIVREIGDRSGQAATLNNLGQVYSHLGDAKRALETYEQAFPILREIGDRRGEATILHNIGAVHSDLGDKKRALETVGEALPIRREIGDRGGEAATLNNLGKVYSELGDKKRALETFEQALPIVREVGDRRGEAVTLNNIGAACSDLGDKERALEMYEQALAIRRESGDRGGEAATLNNIGKVYLDRGDAKRALETFEQALPIVREIGDRRSEAVILFNIARIREKRGEIAEAIALLECVVALDEAVHHPDLVSDRAYLERLRAIQRVGPACGCLAILVILATAVATAWHFLKP